MAKRNKSRQKRIVWIDGLRGLGCLCIFFHHFFFKYYPATYYGTEAESRIRWGLDAKAANMPFFFLLNGNFWVCVYLLLAGIMMMNKKLNTAKGSKLSYFLVTFVNRYLTLVFPIFIGEMLMFIGSSLKPDGIIPDIGYAIPFSQYLKSTFWSSLFVCDRSVMGALWTMQPIFLGGLLILLIRLVFRKKAVQLSVLAAAILVFLQLDDYMYFVPVLAGGIFWILYPVCCRYVKGMGSILCLIAGCFFAAYPSGLIPGGVYGILPFGKYASMGYHLLGAILFVYAIGNLKEIQVVFTNRFARWLGKISYPFYVFHVFMIKATYLLFKKLSLVIPSYSVLCFLIAVTALLLLAVLCVVYTRYLEPRWKQGVDRFMKCFSDKG